MTEPRSSTDVATASPARATLVVVADVRAHEVPAHEVPARSHHLEADVTTVLDATLDALAGRPPADYADVWVLLRRNGLPVADVRFPLMAPRTVVRQQLEHALAVSTHPVLPADDHGLPFVSVVVPTVVQRHDELRACLAGLQAIDYGRYEIVLVDNRPVRPAADPLPEIVAGIENLRVVHASTPGISAARNAGTAHSLGEVVAFTDDDVVVDPNWLRALATRFAEHPEEDVVTGLVVPAELETDAQRAYENHYGGFGGTRRYRPAQVRPTRRRGTVEELDESGSTVREFAIYGIGAFGAGANMAFRRGALHSAGGFDETLGTGTPARGGEDLAMLVDILWTGGRLGYQPLALVHHTHRRGTEELLHQMHGNGVGLTAMLTAAVLRDPRHGLALLRLGGRAALVTADSALRRVRAEPGSGEEAGSPSSRELFRQEFSGYGCGPFAYLRSRRRAGTRRGAGVGVPGPAAAQDVSGVHPVHGPSDERDATVGEVRR